MELLGKIYIVSLPSFSYSGFCFCVAKQFYVSQSSVGSTFTIVNASLQMHTGNSEWIWEIGIDLLEYSVLFLLCKLRSNLWSQISTPISWLRLCKCGWHHTRVAQVAGN